MLVETGLVAVMFFMMFFGFVDMTIRLVEISSLERAAVIVEAVVSETGDLDTAIAMAEKHSPFFMKGCLEISGGTQFSDLSQADLMTGVGGVPLSFPLLPEVKAASFILRCKEEALPRSLTGWFLPVGDLRPWVIAVRP